MQENWGTFFNMLIAHEGGFTDDIHDSGNKKGDGHGNQGSTMLGVTAYNWAKYTGKPAPIDVMKILTVDDVMPLYKSNYWDAIKADDLPSGVDVSCADLCVNAGPRRASKILQKVIGAKADGKIGPKSLAALAAYDPTYILNRYYDERESFYRSLKDYERYGRGWSRRNKETLKEAMELVIF